MCEGVSSLWMGKDKGHWVGMKGRVGDLFMVNENNYSQIFSDSVVLAKLSYNLLQL